MDCACQLFAPIGPVLGKLAPGPLARRITRSGA